MMRVLRISDSMRGSTPGRTAGFTKEMPLGATVKLSSASASWGSGGLLEPRAAARWPDGRRGSKDLGVA
eukprot:366130-Chlamydomonas_euryale.AAC.42